MATSARFTFPLQCVLTQREHREEAAQARFAAEAAQASAARAAVEELQAVRAAGTAALTAAQVAPTSVGHLRAFAFAIEQMDARLDVAGQQVMAAEQRVDEARTALAEAFRARHAIERLRERAHETWRAETALAEQRTMDELAIQQFCRRQARAVNE
ncbi:MAG: flagellar export protein FliJ [Gemmatimonadetes bacterium SCN 70-22]|nr:MAG: flagellar export protein FliJ [Gemmatimonadetes bacterium SCN 70-22]